MIVVATEAERELAKNTFNDYIIVTGVGGLNVIMALQEYDRTIPIINFGYVGGNKIPRGTVVKVGESKLYHPNVEYEEPIYKLNGDTPCYTSNDFVTGTEEPEPCVFDMELAYILALGFENVISIKIVSDNLNINEYEESLK